MSLYQQHLYIFGICYGRKMQATVVNHLIFKKTDVVIFVCQLGVLSLIETDLPKFIRLDYNTAMIIIP